MGLVNPIWLWGLAGLLVPVGIHLLSRKDMRVVRMGSLRHLEDTTTRQTVRIQLHAYVLLALRCLIVSVITLLLAGLFFQSKQPATRWVLVESGLETQPRWRPLIDSLIAEGYAPMRLQAGFPEMEKQLNTDITQSSSPDYWSLAESLNSLPLDRCVVISRGRVMGYAGERPGTDSRITWLTDQADSARFVLASQQKTTGDSIAARVGRSNAGATSFETLTFAGEEKSAVLSAWSDDAKRQGQSDRAQEKTEEKNETASSATNGIALTPSTSALVQSVRVVLSGTHMDDEERRVMRASLKAIADNSFVHIQIVEAEPSIIRETLSHSSRGHSSSDWLIWLSTDPLPAWPMVRVIRKAPDHETNPHQYSDFGENILIAEEDLLAAGDGLPSVANKGAADSIGYNSSVGNASRLTSAPGATSWSITQPLTVSNALQSEFTMRLATVLLGDANRSLNRRAAAHDRRVMPDGEMFSRQPARHVGADGSPLASHGGQGILAIILISLMAVERWIANRQQL